MYSMPCRIILAGGPHSGFMAELDAVPNSLLMMPVDTVWHDDLPGLAADSPRRLAACAGPLEPAPGRMRRLLFKRPPRCEQLVTQLPASAFAPAVATEELSPPLLVAVYKMQTTDIQGKIDHPEAMLRYRFLAYLPAARQVRLTTFRQRGGVLQVIHGWWQCAFSFLLALLVRRRKL